VNCALIKGILEALLQVGVLRLNFNYLVAGSMILGSLILPGGIGNLPPDHRTGGAVDHHGGDMNKILTVATLTALMTSVPLQATPYFGYAQPPVRAPQMESAGAAQVLHEGMSKLLEFMRQPERPSQQAIAAFLHNEIAPYFDFAYMSSWVAGPMNRRMNDQQRVELASSVKQMLLGTLAERLADYQNQDVRFYPARRVGENEVKVRVAILQASGYPANLDFRFYRGRAGWKVFDVTANGSSALTYYRQYFSRQLGGRQMMPRR
jgi:phospholipid transport system substrate-binding protein